MLKLRRQLVLQKVIEMFQLECSALEEFVNVDVLWRPCVRLEGPQEWVSIGVY